MRMYPLAHSVISRQNIVEALNKMFSNATPIVCLQGPEGSGRSEVVIQHCEAFEKISGGGIAFFDASNLASLEQAWRQFAVSSLGIPHNYTSFSTLEEVSGRVHQILQSRSSYLLVFDGVNSEALANIEANYLPTRPTGQILITNL